MKRLVSLAVEKATNVYQRLLRRRLSSAPAYKIELLGGDPTDDMYGEWKTVTSPPLNKDSVVYAFGVGHEASWDLEIIKRFGCDVHAFDMAPGVIAWVCKA